MSVEKEISVFAFPPNDNFKLSNFNEKAYNKTTVFDKINLNFQNGEKLKASSLSGR